MANNWPASVASETLSGLFNRESLIYILLLASERSEHDTLRCVQSRIVDILYILGMSSFQHKWASVLVLHCCSALLQNLAGNSKETHCLEETSRGKCRCSLSSSSNCYLNSVLSLFSLSLSSLCSLSQSSLFSLSTIPSFCSDQLFVLLR